MKMAKQEDIIMVLNPMLRGWANYHRSQVASKAFGRMDALVWKVLWKWCERRHHNKGIMWIKRNTFVPQRLEIGYLAQFIPMKRRN